MQSLNNFVEATQYNIGILPLGVFMDLHNEGETVYMILPHIGRVEVFPGDWIVEEPSGRRFPIRAAIAAEFGLV